MKKTIKGFIIGVIITALLMGNVFGANLKKSIEVIYNSVNLIVNGADIVADNILYEGVTYVPLRAVTEALEAYVEWDQKTYTATITQEVYPEHIELDIEFIKLYSKINNQYYELEILGRNLLTTSDNLSVSANGILALNNDQALLKTKEYFSQRIEWYNDILEPTKSLILEAKGYSRDVSDMYTILDNYYKVIDYYKMALNSLSNYSVTKKDYDFNNYIKAGNLAFELVNEQILTLTKKHYEILSIIQSH